MDTASQGPGVDRSGETTAPPTVSVFKTAVFKIHNPSQHKRAMLKGAMKRAHVAYGRLLEEHLPDEKEVKRLRAMTKRERRAEFLRLKGLFERKATSWKQLSLGAKAAIARECMAQISSFVELHDVQEEVGRPLVTRINAQQPEFEAAVDEFRSVITEEREDTLAHEIARVTRMGTIRPLGFSKVNKSAGFLLLRHPESGRLYCWLNLHPQDGRFAKHVAVSDLINLQTGELMTFRSQTGALFPLEMGRAFHDLGFIERGRPQSARLVWRRERNGVACDDFELHVAFDWTVPKVETSHWLGVDRGIYNLAAYAVVDDEGQVIDQGAVSGRDLRFVQRQFERRLVTQQRRGQIPKGSKRRAWADEAVHVAVNAIVEAARSHSARVVLEDLSSFSAIGKQKRVIGRKRGGFNRLLSRRQYEKLKSVLSYKLTEFGLPQPVFVRAAGTSQTCPECGHWSRDNRIKVPTDDGFEMDKFACVKCSHKADADLNAARIIGMKGRWLTSLPRKSERKGDGKLPDALKFERFLIGCAEKRAGAPVP